MATKVSGDFGLSGQSLIRALRKRTAKREGDANFVGLQRALALSDVDDPQASLNNVLDKISITEVAERNQYGGPYNSLDWGVTSDFIQEDIDKSFLSRLSGASVGGGSLGSTVSITPRIRIHDRLSFLNSFYGEGSYPGLHSGPDAQFYKGPLPNHIGYIKFTFNTDTGAVTVTELKETDGTTNLTESQILGGKQTVVLDLDEYETTGGVVVNLSGFGISLKLESLSTWTVTGTGSLANLVGIDNATKNGVNSTFGTLRFKLVRPYSVLYKPLWFTQSPNDANSAGGADDLDPATTNKILRNEFGTIVPYIEKGYWYSRAYVETRWTPTEAALLTDNQQNNTIIAEDSNMRWQIPPRALRSQAYNWGVRWDGYLLINPGTYALEVQTNVQIKIDLAIASDGSWVNVFDTGSNAAQETVQKYVSAETFDTSTVNSTYKYVYGGGANDWFGYVPVTIRMYHGGPDKSQPELIVPSEPNLFIKTTKLTTAATYYTQEHEITLSGTDGAWSVASTGLSDIIAVLQDTDASVTYRLTAEGDSILTSPVPINLSTDGTNVTSDTTDLSATTYTLKIAPLRSTEFNDNLTALWKGRIASPSATHQNYPDMVDGSHEPNIQKVAFDSRPDWWKVSQGHPYVLDNNPTDDNTPIDGFIPNSFKDVLKSNAEGVGLYGDGGDPVVYSNVPNIILGEARYTAGSELGSNYIGLRLTPNLVGEGGKLNVKALPFNSIESADPFLLGENDLGGSPNHLTAANGKVNANSIRLFLPDATVSDSSDRYNKYYTVAVYNTDADFPATGDDTVVYFDDTNQVFYNWDAETSAYVVKTDMASDNPTTFGFPAFSDDIWLSPITASVVRAADDNTFATNSDAPGSSPYLTAPLTVTVERVTIATFQFLQISTTQASLLRPSGADISAFSGKYIEYYTENNVAFQYLRVDGGQSLSFSDVLKLTYDGSVFSGELSEVPRPPSDRVTPFGFDKPEYTNGLCYPPYAIANTLLSDISIDDDPATGLYTKPVGNYDVFWGYPGASELGGKVLELTEKIEFQNFDGNAVETLTSPITVAYADYTHRLKIDMPLTGSYDPDMLEHIGNEEKVKESYYAYVKLDS